MFRAGAGLKYRGLLNRHRYGLNLLVYVVWEPDDPVNATFQQLNIKPIMRRLDTVDYRFILRKDDFGRRELRPSCIKPQNAVAGCILIGEQVEIIIVYCDVSDAVIKVSDLYPGAVCFA